MADPFAAPDEPAAPAAPPPAPSKEEIEALIAQRVQDLADKRISGLQSVFDKRLAEQAKAHQAELERLRKNIPGYVDDDEPDMTAFTAEIEELKRQNAILRASQTYGKGAKAYQDLIALEAAEEQIAFLESLLTPADPPPAPAPAPPSVEVPDVDPNRPPIREFGWQPGTDMTEEMANLILGSTERWPTR